MKKLIFSAILVLVTVSLSAQLSFGPKIGYNTSKLSVDRSEITTELKNSFQFGLFARIGKKVYFQPELAWLTQGGIFKDEDGKINSPFKQEVSLKTVQVPVMIGYKLIDLKLVNVRVMGGPVASFVTDKEIENKVDNYIDPIKQADIKDAIWSLQLGVGADVAMFTLDIRYNIGLTKIINEIEIEGEPVQFDSKSNGFNITLGWKLL